MSVMLCFWENNAWEMMPEDVGFPGLPEPAEKRKEGLGTDIIQSFLHKDTFFVLRILMLEILF